MDTWATSSLTPQIAGKWADDPDLFARVFPMDLRPQAHDIIRTWLFYTVVRAHLEHGTVPWTNTAISGWVLDPDRKKMSKSKGNVVTPMALLEEHGSDGVRYWAASGRPGTDTTFDPGQMKVGRRLAIKLLNASKFALGRAEPRSAISAPVDRGMLTSLARLVADSTEQLEGYQYATVLERAERWFWSFCDDYLELVKNRRYGAQGEELAGSANSALVVALGSILRVFAPFLPFVTEEVWSWWRDGSVHRAPWPTAAELEAHIGGPDPAGRARARARGARCSARSGRRSPKASGLSRRRSRAWSYTTQSVNLAALRTSLPMSSRRGTSNRRSWWRAMPSARRSRWPVCDPAREHVSRRVGALVRCGLTACHCLPRRTVTSSAGPSPRTSAPVTSRPKRPCAADVRGRGVLLAKSPLVVAGMGVAAMAFALVDPAAVLTARMDDGTPCEPGHHHRRRARARPRAAHGGACRPEFSAAAVRDRDHHAALRRRVRRPHHHPRHAEDDAYVAGAREVRRSHGRGHEPPLRPLRRVPDQGQPHPAGGWHCGCGVERPAAASRSRRSRWRRRASRRWTMRSRRESMCCSWTICRRMPYAKRYGALAAGRRSRSPVVSRSTAWMRSRTPAPISSPWGL